MKKWLTRILIAVLCLTPVAVWADYTATTGAGSTVFAFVCASTKICPATVLIDSSNTEKATSSNPLISNPTTCTPYHLSGGSTASTNSNNVKASAGTLCDGLIINTSTTLGYLKVYDSASSPTCSSATGLKHVYPIPLGPSNIGAGIGPVHPMGEAYASGIAYCLTGGGGDTDNTNGPAGIYVELSFK